MLENPFIIVYGVSKSDTVKRLLDCIPHDLVVENPTVAELQSYRKINSDKRVVIVCKINKSDRNYKRDYIRNHFAQSHRIYKLTIIYQVEDITHICASEACYADFCIVCLENKQSKPTSLIRIFRDDVINKLNELKILQRITRLHETVYSEDSDFKLI